jgi:hypothetical protein
MPYVCDCPKYAQTTVRRCLRTPYVQSSWAKNKSQKKGIKLCKAHQFVYSYGSKKCKAACVVILIIFRLPSPPFPFPWLLRPLQPRVLHRWVLVDFLRSSIRSVSSWWLGRSREEGAYFDSIELGSYSCIEAQSSLPILLHYSPVCEWLHQPRNEIPRKNLGKMYAPKIVFVSPYSCFASVRISDPKL